MGRDVTYDRPVGAKLIIRLDNGDEWEAMKDDLAKFGYGHKLNIYMRAHDMLLEALELEDFDQVPEDLVAHDVRYMIECAITSDHSPWADEKGEQWPAEDGQTDYRARIREALTRDLEEPRRG